MTVPRKPKPLTPEQERGIRDYVAGWPEHQIGIMASEVMALFATLDAARERIAKLENDVRCPTCGCATVEDAEAAECGCDEWPCALEVPETYGQAMNRMGKRIAEVERERNEARLAHECSEGTLVMAVARLGGTVEGHPTHRLDFLQRIDALRVIENECEAWRKADDDVRKLNTDHPNVADALISVNSINVARRLRAQSEEKEAGR